MSVAYIPSDQALTLTYDRVIDILQSKLPAVMTTRFDRDANDFTDGGDGVFLPDPSEYYRQSAPEQNDLLGVEEVEVYTGQSGASSYGDYRNVDGDGKLVEVEVPWAVTILFGVSPQGSIDDPVQGRDLHPREVTQRRANLYAGALKHTVSKWFSIGSGSDTRNNAISRIEEGDDLSTTLQVSVQDSDDPTNLRGLALFDFTIRQRQLLPRTDQT